MKKLLLLILFSQIAFALQGKISLYSGFTFEGEITTVERTHILIIPQSLTTTYEIGVDEIQAVVLDNGFIMVLDGRVEQLYRNGKFLTKSQAIVEDGYVPEMDYSDDISIDGEDYFEEGDLNFTKSDYYSMSFFSGFPIYGRPTLLAKVGSGDNWALPTPIPNIGLSMNSPYYELGPVDISPGGRIMTIGFGAGQLPAFQAIALNAFVNMDFTPILFFLPNNIHIETISGLSMLASVSESYSGGTGIMMGGSVNYRIPDYPIVFRLFGEFHVIPQSGEFSDLKTGFGTIGLSASLIMKRSNGK